MSDQLFVEGRKDSEEYIPSLPESPPMSPIINLSPRPTRKANALSGLKGRQRSLTDVRVQVTDRWDLSPRVRRSSMLFVGRDFVDPQVFLTAVSNKLEQLQTIPEKDEPAKPITRSLSTLEDISREGVLEAAHAGVEYGWRLVEVKEGIWIYRKTEGLVDAFKTCCPFHVPPSAFINVLADLEHSYEWDEWIDKCRVVEKVDEHCSIFYYSYLGGPKTTKRDYCVLTARGICENGTELFTTVSVDHKEVPEYEGYVRGEILMRGFVAKPVIGTTEQSVVVHIAQYDPKGEDLSNEQKNFIALQNGLLIKRIESKAKARMGKKAQKDSE